MTLKKFLLIAVPVLLVVFIFLRIFLPFGWIENIGFLAMYPFLVLGEWQQQNIDNAIIEKAIKEKDVTVCEQLPTIALTSTKYSCYRAYLDKYPNVNVCLQIGDLNKQQVTEFDLGQNFTEISCYTDIATKNFNINICLDYIEKDFEKNKCIQGVYDRNKGRQIIGSEERASYCKGISDFGTKDQCIFDYIQRQDFELLESEYCENISSQRIKDDCYFYVATNNKLACTLKKSESSVNSDVNEVVCAVSQSRKIDDCYRIIDNERKQECISRY